MIFKWKVLRGLVLGIWMWVSSAPALAQGRQPTAVALANANVIPLDHPGIDRNQTVLVRGDRIVQVGDRSEITVPSDALVIGCAGQYLVPGLTDAHAPLYLAYGVTTVVNLSDTPTILDWRRRVKASTLLEPTNYTRGPLSTNRGSTRHRKLSATSPRRQSSATTSSSFTNSFAQQRACLFPHTAAWSKPRGWLAFRS